MLDGTAQAVLGADAGGDDDLAAGAENAGELVQRGFRVRHRRHHVLRDDHVERRVGKVEMLGIHHGEALDVAQAEPRHALARLLEHRRRDIDAHDAGRPPIGRQGQAGPDADFEDATPDPLRRGRRQGSPLREDRPEDQIVHRRPAPIGLGDTVAIEIGAECACAR